MSGHGDLTGHPESMEHTGSLKEYVTGFLLAVFLTAIPFWLVMTHALNGSSATAAVILVFAAVQMVIHMIYFLHMNTKSEGGWTLLALLFTLMLVVIALSGSLWVMYHLNANMMPASMHAMPAVPAVPAVQDLSGARIPSMHDMPGMHDVPAVHDGP